MNIFELLMFISFIAGGYYCGKWIGFYFGTIGWIVGFVLGVLLVVIAWVVLYNLMRLWYKWRPVRPICKNDKCSSDDYEIIESTKDGATFRCRCGTKYFQPGLAGPRFMEKLDDGTVIPYMRRTHAFGRWEREQDCPEN